MASLEWERSSDRPLTGTAENAPAGQEPRPSLEELLAEARAARERLQQATAESIERAERLGARQEHVTAPPHTATPGRHEHSAADWISEHQEDAVERLFALLEQNQLAIAALAQAWRQTSRALRLTQARLAYPERQLAAEEESPLS